MGSRLNILPNSEAGFKMSEEKTKSKDISAIVTDTMKFARKINTLGKAVDYVLVDSMPKVFQDNLRKSL